MDAGVFHGSFSSIPRFTVTMYEGAASEMSSERPVSRLESISIYLGHLQEREVSGGFNEGLGISILGRFSPVFKEGCSGLLGSFLTGVSGQTKRPKRPVLLEGEPEEVSSGRQKQGARRGCPPFLQTLFTKNVCV